MSERRLSAIPASHRQRRGTLGAMAVMAVAITLAGCHSNRRGPRAERLLHELAPSLRLGETLTEAHRAMPSLDVRHPGDSVDMYSAVDSEPPRAVAVVVWPRPAVGERASPTAVVEAVELVMGPSAAARVEKRAMELYGESVRRTCAGRSIDHTDMVLVWEPGNLGGVLLTYPERRPHGEAPTSRLFIYSDGWKPAQAISGFDVAVCSALQ